MRYFFYFLISIFAIQGFAQNSYPDGIDCEIPTDELAINGANDIKAVILLNGSTASSYQPGENIEKSFDGNLNTLYHSNWGYTPFPVILNYRFDGVTPIDYLKYIPRSDGGSNGNFGNVIISYNTTTNSNFQELVTYDFEQSGLPTVVYFPYQITPLNIKLEVQNGYGNFASCAEMEFYTEGETDDSNVIPAIFADEICSALLPGTTQAEIDALSSPFYKTLAQCLFNETYYKRYRTQSYEVYPTISYINETLKVGDYDRFENATGILFEPGQKIALFAKDIPANTVVHLAVKDFETSFDGPVSYFELKNGLNVFELTNGGLGYIAYFNNNNNLGDVTINIVSGKINGYFDNSLEENENWVELLDREVYPMVDLRDEFVHLVYHRDALKIGSPNDGSPLLEKYNTVVKHERMLMGLFKYNKSPKNRMLTYSEYGGGYWAGGLGVHLDLTWGIDAMTDPERLDMWGIPHEYGHINQIRPDLLWIGTTEVTNNIYSVWVNYHMNNEGVPYSRLEAEKVSPAPGMASVAGGRMNGGLFHTVVNEGALQSNNNYDVFEVLVPFWQLELYYSLAGASRNAPPLSFDYPQDYEGIDYAHWYGTVAEIVRTNDNYGLTNGEYLLNFVKNTCDAVEEDLTEFFIQTGFLRPIDVMIDDYGVGQLKITESQIAETIDYIQSKNYEAPVSPVIQYISAHSLDAYKNQLPLEGETGMGVTLSGSYLTVQHSEWKNAVAYETYSEENELIFVSISGTGDLNNQTTRVYYPTNSGSFNAGSVYAVGFDGTRKLVYPDNLNLNEQDLISDLKVYPNPVRDSDDLKIEIKNPESNYRASVLNLDGKIILQTEGDLNEIEKQINRQFKHFNSGIYVLQLLGDKGGNYSVKIIKK